MRRPTVPATPQAEVLALALRTLAAALPDDAITVSIHGHVRGASSGALALLRSLGAVTTAAHDNSMSFVRVRVGGIEITGYEDTPPKKEVTP